MKWVKKTPTEEGFYWIKYGRGLICRCHVFLTDDSKTVLVRTLYNDTFIEGPKHGGKGLKTPGEGPDKTIRFWLPHRTGVKMGIRIHKVLGYGLTDLKTDKEGKITDPRINPEGWLLTDWEYKEDIWTIEGYRDWLKKHLKEHEKGTEGHFNYTMELSLLRERMKKRRKPDLGYRHIIHDSEFGLANVLCITPMFHDDWNRYDDIIDYTESGGMRDYVKLIRSGIYPYNGSFWDSRDGRRVDGQRLNWAPNKEDRARVAQELGFKNLRECNRYMRPIVPAPIRMLCEYCQIFTKTEFVRRLKPMLYVFWS